MSKFVCTTNRILVRRKVAESQTPSGLFIPLESQREEFVMEVVESGDPRYPRGMTVLKTKYGGIEVQWQGESLIVLNTKDDSCEVVGSWVD